ncbi:uncharacterized protein LOC134191391 [Corticium candelabrum]|uniref:uncharacterized protein LOC134191391 n=1 Tax=Corticium candelabrum TaxID=121492 RepID=UPI002E26DE36|nr:uncharacterized protein LOC134191391 [Corticium candelabrum]
MSDNGMVVRLAVEYEVSSVVVADKTSKRFRISSRIGAAAIVCVLILAISAPATTLGKSTTAEQEDAHKLVERRTVDINEPVNSIQDDMPTLSLPPNLAIDINVQHERPTLWFSKECGNSVGGRSYNDSKYHAFTTHETATQFDVWYEKFQNRIAAVRTTLTSGSLHRHGLHSHPRTRDTARETVRLGSDDELARIETYTDKSYGGSGNDVITHLTLVSRGGRVWSIGDRSGRFCRIRVPTGYRAVGVFGRSGWLLDSIGVIAATDGREYEIGSEDYDASGILGK